jgi:hypothetical protein
LPGLQQNVYSSNKPPVDEITLARETLAEAKMKGAGKYAGEKLKEAEKFITSRLKNGKFRTTNSLFQDYSLVSTNWQTNHMQSFAYCH